jgi:hypothetical protein
MPANEVSVMQAARKQVRRRRGGEVNPASLHDGRALTCGLFISLDACEKESGRTAFVQVRA